MLGEMGSMLWRARLMPWAHYGWGGWRWGNMAGIGQVLGHGAGTTGMVVAVPAAACVHTCQAERRLQVLDRKESQAQRRLRELAQRVTALQESGQDAQHMAQQAKDRAQSATTTSGTLSQVSSTPAWLCVTPSR